MKADSRQGKEITTPGCKAFLSFLINHRRGRAFSSRWGLWPHLKTFRGMPSSYSDRCPLSWDGRRWTQGLMSWATLMKHSESEHQRVLCKKVEWTPRVIHPLSGKKTLSAVTRVPSGLYLGTIKCCRRDFCAFFPKPASSPILVRFLFNSA